MSTPLAVQNALYMWVHFLHLIASLMEEMEHCYEQQVILEAECKICRNMTLNNHAALQVLDYIKWFIVPPWIALWRGTHPHVLPSHPGAPLPGSLHSDVKRYNVV